LVGWLDSFKELPPKYQDQTHRKGDGIISCLKSHL